jgi:hypothetical protein
VTIAQVYPENEASKTIEFEEAHRASLFYDFLNLDLLNQESLHLPTAANQACATSRQSRQMGREAYYALALTSSRSRTRFR